MAAADRLRFLCEVIDGTPVMKVRDRNGNETDMTVSADVSDRLKAWDFLNKYGLGTTTAIVDKDGGDAPPPVILLPPLATDT